MTQEKLALAFILDSPMIAIRHEEQRRDTWRGDTELGASQSSAIAVPAKKKKRPSRLHTKQTADYYQGRRRGRECSIDGCTNYSINRGLCFRHGGGKKCSVDACGSSAKIAGRCWKHGGSMECVMTGCDRRGKSRGVCWAHGGGTLCETEGCSKVAVSIGRCWAHGGGKRCLFDGCQRPACERTLNYCPRHFKLMTRTSTESTRIYS